MNNLNTIELKAFVPAKDFEISKQFYLDLGFSKASDSDGIAYFNYGNCSFLLQDFYEKVLAENLVMHLLVEDIASWHKSVKSSGVEEKYGITLSEISEQPWGMLDFVLYDPSGVLWRFGQNVQT
ncbi:VOC family protein [Moritella sp. 5]|uniref:VOC family protein n=1 Tax=Moritella sp. 5 TaxID=2746231 RepID=UPI001BA98829|nr:VOC family protein [Moritella sp. 5]QUM80515.1 VOC family protein [Moritella sp. 5]